jgi:glycerol-3-phosphate dehydrogenase
MKSKRQACDANVDLTKNEQIVDLEARGGIKGIISVTGVKYTTAVQVADKVADMAMLKLGYSHLREIQDPPLAGGDELLDSPTEALQGSTVPNGEAEGTGSHLVAHLMQRYGTLYRRVLQYVWDEPSYGLVLAEGHETITAEVIYAVRHEMACKLSDVILRRTGMGSRAYPGKEAIRKSASIMAQELGWSERRMFEEISAVDLIYNTHPHA